MGIFCIAVSLCNIRTRTKGFIHVHEEIRCCEIVCIEHTDGVKFTGMILIQLLYRPTKSVTLANLQLVETFVNLGAMP